MGKAKLRGNGLFMLNKMLGKKFFLKKIDGYFFYRTCL